MTTSAPPRDVALDRFDGEALLGQAESILRLARAKAPQAEVYLERGAELDVGIEKDAIAAMGTSLSSGGAVRVVADGRLGFAYFTRAEDAPQAIEQAVLQARHAAQKRFTFPAAGRAGRLPGRWDEGLALLRVPDAIGQAKELLRGAHATLADASVAGGGVGVSASVVAIANSEGAAAWDRSTTMSAGASLVLEEGERAISAGEHGSSHSARLDAHAVGVAAAELTASLRAPRPVERGGRFDLILRPEGVSELLVELATDAATGDEARRGKTVWSDKLGSQVAAAGLTLSDDSTAPGAVGGVPFDDEGVPTQPLRILDGGVLRAFMYDAWDAHEHGAASTASAGRGDFKSRPGTTTHHLTLTAAPPHVRPLDKLVGMVEDGFLVESLLGAHTANVTTGDFSVTAPNVWRIRGGQVEGACSDIALAGRLGDWLQKVEAVGATPKTLNGAQLPHVLVRGVDVSV